MPVNNIHHEDDHHGVLSRIIKDIAHAYDWLAGPPMSELDRTKREIAEARPYSNRSTIV